MALTPSTMPPLGMAAPAFTLPDTNSGKTISLDTCVGANGVLVAFICNHCPFVVHIVKELSKAIGDFKPQGVETVLISANDVENYPDDSPEKMKEFAKKHSLICPYLYDESQNVAKAYGAACTPDFFLFDQKRKLVYRGQFDGSRPSSGTAVSGADLRAAVLNLSSGKAIDNDQQPSIGCNIKWK